MRFAPKAWTKAHLKLCWGKGGLAEKGVHFLTEHLVQCGSHVFTVDVYVSPNVVVECDGASHKRRRRQEKDVWKDSLLKQAGFRVLRYSDHQIEREFDEVVNEILGVIK